MQALQKQNYATVQQMLEKSQASIAAALPKHLTVERLSRVALGELRTTPKLLECQPASLMSAIVKASQLGLEVGSAMGHAYLVPYKTECQLIIGYRGMIALARRSGEIISITARVVYAKDDFELEYGLEEKLRHVPSTAEDPGPVTHVYAVARLKDGGVQYEVMTRAEVEAIRKRSKAGNFGPWQTDWSEMARKTVMRRLFKYLPMSIEMADAMSAENDDDRPAERNITPPTADLNAQLAHSVESSQPQPRPETPAQEREQEQEQERREPEVEWPKPNENGELVDARGIPFIEAIHSSAKRCNTDGSWRRARGVNEAQVMTAERDAMTALPELKASEQAPAPEPTATDDKAAEIEASLIRAASTAADDEERAEILDAARVLSPEARDRITAAFNAK